jgi:nitrogen fixation-related uncharacterized protein
MMEWQFWTQLVGVISTIIACVWFLRGWLEKQFNTTRENAHKILDKHEEKDEQRHRENVHALAEMEYHRRESEMKTGERLTAVEVRLAEIVREGGKRTGPGYVARS